MKRAFRALISRGITYLGRCPRLAIFDADTDRLGMTTRLTVRPNTVSLLQGSCGYIALDATERFGNVDARWTIRGRKR
jgi:hypothetical protein